MVQFCFLGGGVFLFCIFFFCSSLYHCIIWLYVLYVSVQNCKLRILFVMFMYSYCYVCSVLGILFQCVILCIVCVWLCTVLLPPGVNPTAVNISYHIVPYNAETERKRRTKKDYNLLDYCLFLYFSLAFFFLEFVTQKKRRCTKWERITGLRYKNLTAANHLVEVGRTGEKYQSPYTCEIYSTGSWSS